MSGMCVPSRTITPVTVRPRSVRLPGTTKPSFASSAMADFRQDDEVGDLPVLNPLAQRPGRAKIEVKFFTRLVFEFGAECRDHRLHGAGAHDLYFSHDEFLPYCRKDRGRATRFRLGADAFDRRAAADEFVFETLEAAVEVIDAVDHRLAFGSESGDDQRHRGAQVGRHHRRALQAVDALDGGGLPVELNARAETAQAPARA